MGGQTRVRGHRDAGGACVSPTDPDLFEGPARLGAVEVDVDVSKLGSVTAELEGGSLPWKLSPFIQRAQASLLVSPAEGKDGSPPKTARRRHRGEGSSGIVLSIR